MGCNQLTIVCYTGGACGDLITALIDPRDTQVNQKSMQLSQLRQRLKKPHLFANKHEKDQYINLIRNHYLSIPSHDFEYHKQNNHDIIAIDVDTDDAALWASNRFKQLHRASVWQQMTTVCSANSVESYAQAMKDFSKMAALHARHSIKLTDIINGNAMTVLATWPGLVINSDANNIYCKWLQQIPQ
jgi:hypothetical protein